MNKKYQYMALMLSLVICLSIFAVPAFARASEYISATTTTISSPSNGKVRIDFYVIGTGIMDKIGVQKIEIYDSTGDRVAIIRNTDWGYAYLMGARRSFYDGSVTYPVDAGRDYYAIVYYYASNSEGSDVVEHQTSITSA